MRFAIPLFTLLTFVSSTLATLFARQNLPSCALGCLASASTGSCSSTDVTCLCKDSSYLNSTSTCIESSCSGSDIQAAETAAEALCLHSGVTLTSSLATATATSTTSQTNGGSVATSINIFAGTVAVLAIAAVFQSSALGI